MTLPAHTPADLAAKAELARTALGNDKWEVPFEDLDWDEMKIRALVDAVLEYAERKQVEGASNL